jgi:hypothetical protein
VKQWSTSRLPKDRDASNPDKPDAINARARALVSPGTRHCRLDNGPQRRVFANQV